MASDVKGWKAVLHIHGANGKVVLLDGVFL